MDRVPDKTHNDSDAVESARNTDAEARRMADEVVYGQFAA
jgi:hypothetical protein